MVPSRIKKICLVAMKKRFPNYEVKDFEIRKTFKYDNEKKDWVDDSYSLFIQLGINKTSVVYEDYRLYEVESYLTSLFGFECCVDFV